MQHTLDPIEERAAEIHRRIAARIRQDPSVLTEALVRLRRRIAVEGDPVDPALADWLDILLMLDPSEVAIFVESSTPFSRRLRISSPLVWLAR